MSERADLERFKVIDQCPVRWEQMQGGRQERTCTQCEHSVVNVSRMSRDQAEQLIVSRQAAGEKVCIYYDLTPDGRIQTEEQVGARRGAHRQTLKLAAAASAALAVSFTATGCGPAPYDAKRSKPRASATQASPTPESTSGLKPGSSPSPSAAPESSEDTQDADSETKRE